MTSPQPQQPNGVERALSLVIVVVVGLVLMAAGLLGALYQIEHPPIEKMLVYVFIGVALLGALLLPSVFTSLFPRVKQIFVLVFPNGLPIIGGRRSGDPQPPGNP